jgi:hypothetical protein
VGHNFAKRYCQKIEKARIPKESPTQHN